ncbi:MAG TPA: hypothetical protein VN760_13120, partial [Casimicrobiaceae bacterium]|nr:hypothetical protein [Casimicrobiaceae bacterium]
MLHLRPTRTALLLGALASLVMSGCASLRPADDGRPADTAAIAAAAATAATDEAQHANAPADVAPGAR